MATAPTPGGNKPAASRYRITVNGETVTFDPEGITLPEQVAIRKQLGLPWEAFSTSEQAIGGDTLAVYFWVGLRQGPKPNLSWRQFGFDWPGFDASRGDDVVEITDDDPEEEITDADPEPSGPGS